MLRLCVRVDTCARAGADPREHGRVVTRDELCEWALTTVRWSLLERAAAAVLVAVAIVVWPEGSHLTWRACAPGDVPLSCCSASRSRSA